MSVSIRLLRVLAFALHILCLGVVVARGDVAVQAAAPSASNGVVPEAQSQPEKVLAEVTTGASLRVVVIPIREQISKPILYIVRRGLKEAIDQKADVVVLDMKTPGGALDVTFEIMEALDRFPGKMVTYVDNEAISAGAFIAAMTDEIWFAPGGVIGAAAPVLSTGGEIDESMKQKIVSYLRARVRAASEGKGYRGEVISAMIDANYELKVGDTVLKPKGELLSLTASEAFKSYGEPPQPLLAAGIAENKEALLTTLKADPSRIQNLTITWSENAAVILTNLAPVLLGLGLLAAFVEFKTPGFGIFGIAAGVLLSAVFFGHYVAGFSGHEPILVFLLGLAALLIELFFFPGIVVLALSGVILMLGALVWSMADLWPNEPIEFSGQIFFTPLLNLGAGLIIAGVLAVLLARFLPKSWIWDRMVLTTSIAGHAQSSGSTPELIQTEVSLIGAHGVAATALYPSGQIEIDGRRYEARARLGSIDRGQPVVVTQRSEFGWIVEVVRT
ncbi:MAG TPA: NfeD family protein [Opitutaceae bacterium]|nr:NfeD family protein [Opitutaceae bacterium]